MPGRRGAARPPEMTWTSAILSLLIQAPSDLGCQVPNVLENLMAV
ncbi:hypothetical protein GDO81_020871 [Engystomops pustulosus]|uniref:Uncharacterized protein n=1 Tax=Engystomops pustulosus TaxID=76066 RepID=A0AAV6Z8F1_ENGPU|nr:hypothetical protein GDO81_020871 [Engystomops pustulosus]